MKKIISIVVLSLLCRNLRFASVEEVLKEIGKELSVETHSPLITSHILTVLFQLPLANVLPSGL